MQQNHEFNTIVVRKKKELPLLENVTITGIAAEGKAIVRVDDLVVFVPYAVPGDVVDIQIRRKKHHYAEAEVVRFVKESPERVIPKCRHFGICGGCKWQMLPYDAQLRQKQQQVVDALTRIGKVELPEISPIIGADRTECYRNKLEYTFSNKRWLTREEINSDCLRGNAAGFHIPGAFDKVLNIDECVLQDDVSNRIRNEVRRFAEQENIPFIDLRTHEGVLRNMVVRTAGQGGLMIILICKVETAEEQKQLEVLLNHIATTFPEITSLMYAVNNKCNDSIADLSVETYRGNDYIIEQMEDLQFKVGPKSFYQTNSQQALKLYQVVRRMAGLTGMELVYDLYTGTGTIANFVARQAREVIGIEYVSEAIEDARVNSRMNGIDNTRFYAGDMKDILTSAFVEENGRPDVIITDPPRAGMHPDVVNVLLDTRPKRIVYVSCNPATQARDLQLMDNLYVVKAVQPVDMFPHTHHVENVALLELRN